MPEGSAAVDSGGTKSTSWAQRLGGSLPSRLQRNVLEIGLEKDQRGAFHVSDEECAKLLDKIGLGSLPIGQIEGVQICPNGKGVIYVILKDGIKLDNFCKHDVFTVTQSGIRSTLIKPASKREIIVTIRGLHPNTRDSLVLDYLAKFGTILSTKVMYGSFLSGPLEGLKNGSRSYKLELKAGVNIGSYHYLDGQKVTLRYSGQKQTCGRCHHDAPYCVGKGLAKECEQNGGLRIEFSQYILNLWKKIGYTPPVDVEEIDSEDEPIVEEFTPHKAPISNENLDTGISIRKFSKDADQGEIIDFIIENGLPEDMKENIHFKESGVVTIANVENDICKVLKNNIHGKSFLGKRLNCNGIIPLTPEKADAQINIIRNDADGSALSDSEKSVSQARKSQAFVAAKEVFESAISTDSGVQKACPVDMARRHSLSLLNRTPPKGSLAEDLLAVNSPRSDLQKAKSALNELKDLTDRLSEFGSCLSNSESAHSDTPHEECNSSKEKKKRKKKRKLQVTPDKDSFLKKPNLNNK